MIYILESEISNKKSVSVSIQTIFGIGKKQALLICKNLGFSANLTVSDLSTDQVTQLVLFIDNSNIIITSELKKIRTLILKDLVEIKSYRGLRKIRGLPIRGQRTHTNAKTSKKYRKF